MTANSAQPTASAVDPNADLTGDWSWKSDRYPEDPGYIGSAADRETVEFERFLQMSCCPDIRLQALWPWSFPAYNGRDLAFKPVRIGPRS